MYEVAKRLFIGTERDCFYSEKNEWAVIHACKFPCHQRALSYRGSLPSNHPHYLTYERGSHLFLNIIDPLQPLFKLPLFTASLDFIDNYIDERQVLIHCNHGLSRAPSIALLWLAKRKNAITNVSYRDAYTEFNKIYPQYQPGNGIAHYLLDHWLEIE